MDTGVFDENRYFDVSVEYAKGSPEDILVRIKVANRGPDAADLHLLPTVWFRNTWSWGDDPVVKPELHARARRRDRAERAALRPAAGCLPKARRNCCSPKTKPTSRRLYGYGERVRATSRTASTTTWCTATPAPSIPSGTGTKAAAHYRLTRRRRGDASTVRLRLTDTVAASGGLRRGLRPHLRRRAYAKPTSSTPPSCPPTSRRTRAT